MALAAVTLLRWLRNGVVAIVAVALVACGVIYGLSQRILRRTWADPPVSIAVPADSASIVEGRRLAQLRGCSGGCHGSEIEGEVFADDFLFGTFVAPNLTAAVREYSDADLARIIRRGVRPDGRTLVVMPSQMFSAMTDADLGKILAYLHSVPPRPGPGRKVRVGPLARLGVLLGKYQTTRERVRRADSVASVFPRPADSTTAGAYLARTVCTECHGLDLTGARPREGGGPPDLRIVAGYSAEAFTHLLRTGKAPGERELRLMSRVARSRFSHFTDQEIAALRTYLVARAAGGS